MRNEMMDCKECLPLIVSYHDEELSEAQAAPLRQHLMDCSTCRKALAGEKSFKRWFPATPLDEVQVPSGFAARVAASAFAGELTSGEREGASEIIPAQSLAAVAGDSNKPDTPILSFVVWATALAAGMLLVISGMLFQERLGTGDTMHANPRVVSFSELLEKSNALSDPAGNGELGGGALEDMSDKNTKLPDSEPIQGGELFQPENRGSSEKQ